MTVACETQVIRIVKGASQDVVAKIVNCDDTPFDLNGLIAASAIFQSVTLGSPIIKTLAASGLSLDGDDALGRLKVSLTPTDTSNLYEGEEQDWVMHMDFGGSRFPKVVFEDSLSVFADPSSQF